jgi:hypothetical protein
MVQPSIRRNWCQCCHLRAAQLRVMDLLDLASPEAALLQSQPPILSKQQSYLLVACFTLVSLGFVVQSPQEGYSSKFYIISMRCYYH